MSSPAGMKTEVTYISVLHFVCRSVCVQGNFELKQIMLHPTKMDIVNYLQRQHIFTIRSQGFFTGLSKGIDMSNADLHNYMHSYLYSSEA